MKSKFSSILILIVLSMAFQISAQHRGDLLNFQGIDYVISEGYSSLSIGNALTSANGNLQTMYYNPAGLVGLQKFQMSVGYSSHSLIWRENQRYRPNRQFATLSFYLDGLYIPDPKNNNKWDYEVFQEDTNYHVEVPPYGLDEYSKEAADWQKEKKNSNWNQIVLGVPVNLFNRSWTVAGAVNRLPIFDYDRNDTYLTPHISTDQYNDIPPRVVGEQDSVRMNWYRFERMREGDILTFRTAIATELFTNFDVGLGFKYLNGKSDDKLNLNKIGYFDLMGGYNQYKFSYDTSYTQDVGTSKYKGFGLSFGASYRLEKISIGINVDLPWTIKREWEYTEEHDGQKTVLKGTNKVKIGGSYAAGISIYPHDKLTMRLALRKNDYSANSYSFAIADSTHRPWVDQNVFAAAIEYRPFSWLQLTGNYEAFGEVFVPDGNGNDAQGPASSVYSLGVSFWAYHSRIDFQFRRKVLKYSDIYFSNTNYNYFQRDILTVNYSFLF